MVRSVAGDRGGLGVTVVTVLTPISAWRPVELTFAEQGYMFDGRSMRYRDSETGRYVSESKLTALRDEVAALAEDQLRRVGMNAPGTAADVIRAGLIESTQNAITVNYLIGAGGVNNMTEARWQELAALNQKAAEEIGAAVWMDRPGEYSDAQRMNFAGLNSGYSVAAYSTGQASALGVELPAHPAVGTECGGNCRCSWSIKTSIRGRGKNRIRRIEATWNASDDDRTCSTCTERAGRYNPWTMDVPVDEDEVS